MIAAWGCHFTSAGGRGGRSASPAIARVYLSVRALARDLGRDDQSKVSASPAANPVCPRRWPTATMPTSWASPPVARWTASATTRCCGCSATAGCASLSNLLRPWDGVAGGGPADPPESVVYLDVDDALEIFGAIIGGTTTQAAEQLRNRAALAGALARRSTTRSTRTPTR